MVLVSGVLAGAIDYYITAKFNNLRSDAVYVKVRCFVFCCQDCSIPLLKAMLALQTHVV